MGPNLRSCGEKAEDLIGFIKSAEFESIIAAAVNKEVLVLRHEISNLKSELDVLKQTNIDLIRLLSNKSDLNNIESSTKSSIVTTNLTKKPQSFAEKVKVSKKEVTQNILVKKNIDNNIKSMDVSDKDKWDVVTRNRNINKRKNTSTVYGNVENTAIKGATQFSHFHVTGLDPGVTEEDVTKYLQEKKVDNIKCVKMLAKRPDEYASFKLSVPVIYKDLMKSPDTWPLYVRVNPFLFRLVKVVSTI